MHFGAIDIIMLLGGGELLRGLVSKVETWKENVVVVLSPRHATEKGRVNDTSLEEYIRFKNIPCIITENINDVAITNLITKRTLGLSISAAWIFRENFIELFGGRLVNIHGSALPSFRGGGGYSWPIMTGAKSGGSTLHLVDTGVDTGDIVLTDTYDFPKSCRMARDCERFAQEKSIELLQNFLEKVRKGENFVLRTQDDSKSTYWPRLSTEAQGYIDWSWCCQDIEKFICAFDEPYAGASTFVGEKKIRLKDCHSDQSEESFHPFQQGIVYRIYDNSLFVACIGGSLIIKHVYNDIGKDITESIVIGDRLHTPHEYLEAAMQKRTIYTPKGLKG